MSLTPASTVRSNAGISRWRWRRAFTASFALAVLAPHAARAEIEVFRGALTLKALVEEEYDSNIFVDSREVNDSITSFTPSGEFARAAGIVHVNATLGARIRHFLNHTSQDSSDPFARVEFNVDRTDTKLEGFLHLDARRAEEPDPLVNARPKYDQFQIDTGWGFYPLEKFGYRINGLFDDRDYQVAGMSDLRTKSVGTDLEYLYSEKVLFFAGVGGRWVTTYHVPASLMSLNSEDLKYQVGAQAEAFSKVTGRIAAGWVRRRFQTTEGGTQEGLLFEGSLAWRVDDETTVTFVLDRDFDTTPIDQSVMVLTASIDVRREIRQKVVVTGGVSRMHANFVGGLPQRRDDAYFGRTGLEYTLTRRLLLGAHVSYNVTDSNQATSDYSRVIAGVSVTAIY